MAYNSNNHLLLYVYEQFAEQGAEGVTALLRVSTLLHLEQLAKEREGPQY